MKKNNNKFRTNNNNSMYNLNYRFDSVSPAGKFSGTALDLIKRYNDLAKEAHASGNYVEMEVFRQYAEHYRKIVTEINERKAANQQQSQQMQTEETQQEKQEIQEIQSESADSVTQSEEKEPKQEVVTQKPLSLKRKTLKIVEVKENDNIIKEDEQVKPKRVYKKKQKQEVQPQDAAV